MKDLKVLVVDDSLTMRSIVKNIIMGIDISKENIFEAADGKIAIDLVKENKFDIILSDWNMPVMNGLEFLTELRTFDKKIPFIMITTEGGKIDVITALKAGANNYIVKPFERETLIEKLNSLKLV